jgi:two-component system, LytTR family, response regulator
MILKTIIVDDEELARKGLRHLLKGEDVQVIAECKDGVEACDAISTLQPDLVFLDIQMPGLNGFEVIANLKMEKLPYFIFVTAYDTFALEAFRVHAVDYLLKPVNEQLFRDAFLRIKKLIDNDRQGFFNQKLSALVDDAAREKKSLKRLVVKERGKTIVLNLEKVLWFSADGDYVKIHTKEDVFLYRERLSKLEGQLNPSEFCRIHRSTIIRLDLVKEFEPISKGDYLVKTISGRQFTLSRSYRDHFFSALK